MANRLKIVFALLIIVVISGLIISRIGYKLRQQERLYNRNELRLMEGKLRKQGVRTCFIQPRYGNRENLVVMMDFWENDEEKIMENLEEIKSTVNQYTSKADNNITTPIFKYLDNDGYNLEDIIRTRKDIEQSDTYFEYYDIVDRFRTELRSKLTIAFDEIIDPENYKFKIIADINYDVTLDTYSAKKIYFFAIFNEADTEQLKAIRIAYKRIADFDIARGDKIFFYNMKNYEFELITVMRNLMEKDNTEAVTQVVVFEPLENSNQVHKQYEEIVTERISPEESPAPTPRITAPVDRTISPKPEGARLPVLPTISPESSPQLPEGSPSPEMTATAEPTITLTPEKTPEKSLWDSWFKVKY
ncbi:MAG: hypothetical protein ACLFQV_09045 [Vulcanimicrobiota bacterium]